MAVCEREGRTGMCVLVLVVGGGPAPLAKAFCGCLEGRKIWTPAELQWVY